MVLALQDFLNPQYLLPLLSAVLVAGVGLLGAPGSRQRAKHEVELYAALKDAGLIAESESVRVVLDRRLNGWRFWSVNRVVLAVLVSQFVGMVVFVLVSVGSKQPPTDRGVVVLLVTTFVLTTLISIGVAVLVDLPNRHRPH